MKQLFFVIIISLLTVPVFSNDKDLIVVRGTSKLADPASARKEIYEKVTTEKTLGIIKRLIGRKESAKNYFRQCDI